MDTETLSKTAFGKIFVKAVAAGMESRFRYRFFPPKKILKGADIVHGQTVLEVGCGTGYFTIPLAQIVGDGGSLTAMDILQESVDHVTSLVKTADLKNVRVTKCSALDTGFDDEAFHAVLLFGVIPAPMLPLERLLPEMHRILKPAGDLAVWPPVPGWLPHSILKSGLFTLTNKRLGVYNFRRT